MTDRLTKQELTWLLTQEARSAAEKLRRGVSVRAPASPEAVAIGTSVALEPELDALDDAMRMLSTLQKGPTASRGRRGRIDLAALVWEIAPNARVQIEPGSSGTEVFGDEAELRRVIQLLISSSNVGGGSPESSAPEVSIRGVGDEVTLSVVLGPDVSATAATERAWLTRMAMRYGGRLVLDGATQSVILPSDGSFEKGEVEQLKRELEAAQKQGEAYARELAAVSTHADAAEAAAHSSRPAAAAPIGMLAAFSASIAAQLRGVLAGASRDLALFTDGGGGDDAGASLGARIAAASEIVAELARIGGARLDEERHAVDLSEVVRQAVRETSVRAVRAGARVEIDAGASADLEAPPAALELLVRTLLEHAIAASPENASVRLRVTPGRNGGAALLVDDRGASVPPTRRRALLALETDAATLGRPPGVALLVASTLCTFLGATIELDDAPGGGVRVRVIFA